MVILEKMIKLRKSLNNFYLTCFLINSWKILKNPMFILKGKIYRLKIYISVLIKDIYNLRCVVHI